MKKRMTSLFLALALCLGLLPLSALAAAEGAPDKLYVGNQNVRSGSETTYWATTDSGELELVEGASDTSNNWNVKYDPSTATLTLKNATIIGVPDNVNTVGAGIYAASSSGPVSLNIVLVGENKVTGVYGINVSSEGAASLSITDSGSLTVSATAANGIGIFVQAQSDANLTIDGANVNAVVTETNGRGVELRTGQDGNPNLTIEVKGGSLQASGQPNGIIFFTNKNNTQAKANLKVSGNAMVKTSGITTDADGSGVQPPDLTTEAGTGETGGIVFDGNKGTVYGSVTLQENLTIGEGESLTIPGGSSLTVPEDKTITVESGGNLEGTPTGTVVYAPTITTESLLDGEVGTAYSQTLVATGDPTITWNVSNGSLPEVLSLDASTGVISGTPTTAGKSTFTVTATNAYGSDSKKLSITINEPATISVTGVSLDQSALTITEGDTVQLTATVEPSNATNKGVTWKSSNDTIATVDNNGKVTAVKEGTATITATVDGKSATCTVTVTAPPEPTPPPYIPPTYAVTVPDTTGGTVEVSPSRASSGRRVTITTQPAPGYELESLTVLDSRGSEIALTDQGDGKFTFTMPSRKVTVQASFAPVPLPFEDVPPGAWYESAVRYVYTHSIMEGMSATTFVPGKSLTRAEAVQVLYNLEDQPTVSESSTFPDLVYEWYKPAIAWAESTGVVDGYEDGTFQPGDSITRQEFAQMLYNYAKYKGHDLTAEGDLSSFPDGDSVQEWALSAMSWANGNALINGHDDGTLEPGGTTIRAQAASILMRFDQNLAE